MLTWYYDLHRSNDILDVFKTFEDFGRPLEKKVQDSVDETGIKLEMPGVKQSELDITVEGRRLKVKAKSSKTNKEYSYSYSLNSAVDESSITAKLEDGLLEINLPKKPESVPRKIKVH